ncbi:DUF4381 domain-containing protein [Tropicimonas aquimaris]|uniref:DUF4381 domain-containing protein n=1 Tax=Tropicimonas aquimaris TaxID=914152 RepID=A0ABW3ITI0_9RHOB
MADLPDTDGKNLVEMLDMLKPVPEPAPISMWPATGGWIWLGLVLLALALLGGWRWREHRRANAYRRAALAEIGQAGDDPARLAEILRRAALSAYPRAQVASETGADWLAFLAASCPGCDFTGEAGKALVQAPWRPLPPDPAVTRLVETWVRRHRRGEAAA